MKVLLLLVCALLCLLPVMAIPHDKHVSRKETHNTDTHTALVEQASESEITADQSSELMASLKSLLAQRKASENAARNKLEAAAKHTLAVEQALAEKSRQLKAHNAMLNRLEQCLNQGPAESRFKQMEQKIKEQEASLVEEHATISTQQKRLQDQQSEIQHQKDMLAKQQADIIAKETALAKQDEALHQKTALLSVKEQQLQHNAEKLKAEEAAAQQRIDEAVKARLDEIKAKLQAKHEAQLETVKQAMIEQARAVAQESQTALIQKKASRIASVHSFHALTSVDDDSPYAQAAAEAEAEEHDVAPAAFEGDAPMSLIESTATTHVSGGRNSTWTKKLDAHCARYKSCSKCSKDGRCGWCAQDGGKCLSLDVNANSRKGSSGDGLTSGQCTSDNWQTSVAARLTFLTLNVFASERANSTRRFAAIVQLIKKASPDVVALQEVERWFVHALQAHSWVKNNYHFSEYGPGQAPGGLYILSRYPIAGTSYYEEIKPGQVEVNQRGRVLVAKLGVKQQAVYVANTNLDYRSSENRAANLNYITTVLKPYAHVVLLGDFNFDEGSKLEATALPKSYIDLWPTLNPDKPGYTWDPRSNWFAAASDPLARSSRIDRIFVKSNQWMPRAIHLVGCSVADPLCGAKNLDTKAGVTLINTNKHNPAVILAAPTNKDDHKVDVAAPQWGTKIFLESEIGLSLEGTAEHALVSRALAEASEWEDEVALVEMGAAPKPTFERDFVPSNHFGLLAQITQFAPKCPIN